jgi:putative ABC transport system permease protein
VACLAVGLGVTVVAAGAAAARAARSRPLAALTAPADAPPRGPGWARRVAAPVILLAGAVPLARGVGTATVALGALLLLAGAGLAAPMLLRPLTAPSRHLLAAVIGVPGRLAGREMLRNPRRVAGAAATLAVAVAMIAIVSAFAATITSSSALDVTRSLRADYVISTPPQSGLDPALAGRIARLPGVASVAGMPCGVFQAPGFSEKLCGIDPAAYARLVDPHVSAGRLADLTGGTMAVSARTAARTNWHLGQTLSIAYPLGGRRPVRIVALYDYDEVAMGYLIPATDFAHAFPPAQQSYETLLVGAEPGAAQQLRGPLAALLAAYPQATLDDRAGYTHQVTAGIDLLATVLTGLLALSLLIGLLSTATTLALTVLERTREIGLLRAIGAEARQIRTIIRAEALSTVITGAIIGVVLGLAIGWPLARAIDGRVIGPPVVPLPLLAAIVPAAVLAGLLAAAVPARRAARLDLLTALRAE